MTDEIMHLKFIRDELEKVNLSFNGNTLEKAMQICEITEQLHLAIFYVNSVINIVTVCQFFEEKQRE